MISSPRAGIRRHRTYISSPTPDKSLWFDFGAFIFIFIGKIFGQYYLYLYFVLQRVPCFTELFIFFFWTFFFLFEIVFLGGSIFHLNRKIYWGSFFKIATGAKSPSHSTRYSELSAFQYVKFPVTSVTHYRLLLYKLQNLIYN